jgi:ADP-heptose:LPS heptosyltransferase
MRLGSINLMHQIFKYFVKQLLLKIDFFITLGLNSNHKNGIVLIRLDAIGDFIIWLDTAKEYRRIYPNQKITLLANKAWADLAKSLPYWDEVLIVDVSRLTRKLFYRYTVLRKLRHANFETAIQPTFSRVFMHGDSMVRATHAKHRIGSVGDTSNINISDKAISDKWYTQLIPANSKPLMELIRNAEFVSNLTGKIFTGSLPKLPIISLLPERLRFDRPYIILFPGASRQGRKWPQECFYEVGKELNQRFGWQVLLCGADCDYPICQKIYEILPSVFVNLAGKTSLQELAELIREARILISNETSAVHIATAVGTPTVCILGGGHFGRFLPYPEHLKGAKPLVAYKHMSCFNCNWKCVQPHDSTGAVPCITGLSVEQVLGFIPKALIAVPNSI